MGVCYTAGVMTSPNDELREIPLFPLNLVLFPGMPLPLHIFEERYKAMIGDCMRYNTPFGVSLIRSGQEVGRRGRSAAHRHHHEGVAVADAWNRDASTS